MAPREDPTQQNTSGSSSGHQRSAGPLLHQIGVNALGSSENSSAHPTIPGNYQGQLSDTVILQQARFAPQQTQLGIAREADTIMPSYEYRSVMRERDESAPASPASDSDATLVAGSDQNDASSAWDSDATTAVGSYHGMLYDDASGFDSDAVMSEASDQDSFFDGFGIYDPDAVMSEGSSQDMRYGDASVSDSDGTIPEGSNQNMIHGNASSESGSDITVTPRSDQDSAITPGSDMELDAASDDSDTDVDFPNAPPNSPSAMSERSLSPGLTSGGLAIPPCITRDTSPESSETLSFGNSPEPRPLLSDPDFDPPTLFDALRDLPTFNPPSRVANPPCLTPPGLDFPQLEMLTAGKKLDLRCELATVEQLSEYIRMFGGAGTYLPRPAPLYVSGRSKMTKLVTYVLKCVWNYRGRLQAAERSGKLAAPGPFTTGFSLRDHGAGVWAVEMPSGKGFFLACGFDGHSTRDTRIFIGHLGKILETIYEREQATSTAIDDREAFLATIADDEDMLMVVGSST